MSKEGTTRGDNVSMPFYGILTMPMINELSDGSDIVQAWYADDGNGCGKISELNNWWRKLWRIGPKYGYCPNPGKTVLIVKNTRDHELACHLFTPLGITVSMEGERHLGAVIGT